MPTQEMFRQQANRTRLIAFTTLLACGALLALSTNMAKVSNTLGFAQFPYLTWSLAGATLMLGLLSLAKRQPLPLKRPALVYYFVAAFLSVAGSNFIFFSAVSKVGVSFVALTLSLPPLLTYLGALMLGMESFNRWRAAGVAFALAGAGVLVMAKWSSATDDRLWILLTLLGPVLLAAGNLYRSSHWPKGAKAESLAPGMLMAATLILALAGSAGPQGIMLTDLDGAKTGLLVLQALVFATQFKLLFILQKAGGPVFLSLIGAVSAAFGIPVSVALLGEPLLPAIIPAAIFMLVAIVCMLHGQKQVQAV
ncbi:DMT family transporter [Bowmanella dokdonensis]|uniref:DMT family transporter n=1 Tax=Bowmanella dokdonensis TaxID=751969 RepID=A0A939DNU1_9ALTE|nr:DMT family transporter [Bowmanella dokdonensis]MBN7825627.1 DMT family transporter [Bowmanella dokdonensis]